MKKLKKDREKSAPMTTEEEICSSPTEELLRQAEIILEQYADAFEKLANS